MKTILITGASGYVGGRLIQAIDPTKYRVIALYSNTPLPKHLTKLPHVSPLQVNLTNPDQVKRALIGVDQVFHLAAYAKMWAKNPSTFYRVNVEGTQWLLDAAVMHGVERVVFTSTAGTFGPQTSSTPISENTQPTAPPFTEYERTKSLALDMAFSYTNTLDVIAVSPTRVYGPGTMSQSNAVTHILERYRKGRFRFLPGNGKSIGNYAYVDDVVNGHLLALSKGKSGENYILGGENLSFVDLFTLMGEVTGNPRSVFPLPLPLLNASAQFMDWRATKFGMEPAILPEFVKKYMHHWETDISKAKRELGYEVTPALEALGITFNWIQANYP